MRLKLQPDLRVGKLDCCDGHQHGDEVHMTSIWFQTQNHLCPPVLHFLLVDQPNFSFDCRPVKRSKGSHQYG